MTKWSIIEDHIYYKNHRHDTQHNDIQHNDTELWAPDQPDSTVGGSLMEQHILKNVDNCWKTNINSYLETCGGQSSFGSC